MGAGTGFERGAQSISNSVLSGIRLDLQRQRNEQLDKLAELRMEMLDAWNRGIEGRPSRYQEEEEAARAAATRPAIPSSEPIVTPGPLGIPQTRFETGKPVQPIPIDTPRAPGGAMSLLPPNMRPPSLGVPPGMRRRY